MNKPKWTNRNIFIINLNIYGGQMPLAAHPKTLTAPTCKAVETKKRFSTTLAAAAGVASLRDGGRL